MITKDDSEAAALALIYCRLKLANACAEEAILERMMSEDPEERENAGLEEPDRVGLDREAQAWRDFVKSERKRLKR